MRFFANKFIFSIVLFSIVNFAVVGQEASRYQSKNLPRSSPEAQGISSEAIFDFIKTADKEVKSLHSFMLVRHGHIVAEAWWSPESADKPHVLWSLSKSFTSTAVGLAIEEGKLSLDDQVIQFFPDQLPDEVSENLKLMRIRDLLTMSAGHEKEVQLLGQRNWIKSFLAHPVTFKPGTHFKYNTPATFMLSAIVQKVTGVTILEYLQPKLFKPLGIEKPTWQENSQGISIGGYGLFLQTEDIAKFGQLYLQNGKWQNRQIIPSDWIAQATSKQVSNGDDPNNDWNQGYGFQFWRCRHNCYRGDGKDGQFCIVIPEKNAVVVMTANSTDLAKQMELVWNKLLPAMADKPLPINEGSQQKLIKFTQQLKASR